MKKLSAIICIMLMAWMLQACNPAKNDHGTADTTAVVPDTSTTLHLAVDKEDTEFAVEAANEGMTEVALGKLAIQKGKSKKIKNFGIMMVKDHGKANNKLIAIIKSKNITLPTMPDTGAQKIMAELSKKSEGDFDNAYINAMIADHQKYVRVFDNASKKCQDPDLKAFAIKTLPILQKHLDAINAIHDSMK